MVIDYDLKLGNSQLRDRGWRGLAALGLLLALRAAMVGIVAVSARRAVSYLRQLVERLLGA